MIQRVSITTAVRKLDDAVSIDNNDPVVIAVADQQVVIRKRLDRTGGGQTDIRDYVQNTSTVGMPGEGARADLHEPIVPGIADPYACLPVEDGIVNV